MMPGFPFVAEVVHRESTITASWHGWSGHCRVGACHRDFTCQCLLLAMRWSVQHVAFWYNVALGVAGIALAVVGPTLQRRRRRRGKRSFWSLWNSATVGGIGLIGWFSAAAYISGPGTVGIWSFLEWVTAACAFCTAFIGTLRGLDRNQRGPDHAR